PSASRRSRRRCRRAPARRRRAGSTRSTAWRTSVVGDVRGGCARWPHTGPGLFGGVPPVGAKADRGPGPATKALDEARPHEDRHRWRQPADDEADREEPDAGGEWASEPAPVDAPRGETEPDQRA